MKDSRIRSVMKGVSWRIVATMDTFFLAFVIFGSIQIAAPIAGTEILTKIILYFFHERAWNLISWGRDAHAPKRARSLAKGVSWRIFGGIDTIAIASLYSGNTFGAFQLGAFEVATKIFIYFAHERVWALIKWGRIYEEAPPAAMGCR